MNQGDMVECKRSYGYCLTTGKLYEVVRFEPSYPDAWYTWPAYVQVIDDMGKLVTCHAWRFEKSSLVVAH